MFAFLKTFSVLARHRHMNVITCEDVPSSKFFCFRLDKFHWVDIPPMYFFSPDEYYWYFAMTLLFILLPCFIMALFNLRWYLRGRIENKRLNLHHHSPSRCTWIARIMSIVLGLSPAFR